MWVKTGDRTYRSDQYELKLEQDEKTLSVYRLLATTSPKIQIAQSEFKAITEQEALRWAEDIVQSSSDLAALFCDVGG